jgi:dipeptidyl-peptidase-4
MAQAQPASPAQALYDQIDRIFQQREYDAPRFGPARWLPGGSAYAIVEPVAAPSKGREIVRYDAATGARSVLVAASLLTPKGAAAPLDVSDYAWSADGGRLLVFTNTRKVWRDNTRGDYWVLTLQGGSLRKVGGEAPEASLMFAKFSPDGTRVAYVRGNNLYVERLDDGRIAQLTRDGSATTINGTSDWVYEEELGVRDAFRWSPDCRNLAYWQFDTTGVGIFSLINTTDTLYPAITRIPYPKAGTANSAVRIGVVGVGGGETRWLKTPGDPRNSYLARMDWVDSATVAIEQLNRQQNQNDFLMGDAASGETRRVFRDESKTWVDLVAEVKLYDTIYQERYMGLPQDNVEGYRIGSPINFAEGLKGNLLIVHGSGDDNVHYQGTERLINRLVELGKPFDTMVYPNRTHSISEGPGTTPHVYKLIARYFLEHLPPGPR